MRSKSLIAVSAAILALSALPAFANQSNAARELSKEERASLANGALVQRPLTQRRGSLDLMGGTSYQVIDAAPEVVWRALLDTPRYARMMPQVLEAKVVRSKGAERTVFVRQGAGPVQKAYYLKVNVHEDQKDITFSVDERRPHDLRAAWGFYNVRPYADGSKTLLAYGVMADLGGGIVVALVRDEVHSWMLKVPQTVKRFVEGRGKKLYQSPVLARR
ncbi:MAG TPA: SRPBCC family protein [Polyangiales bacterium]|nr:SRPBCC family protein [Polyangiales bacterium]